MAILTVFMIELNLSGHNGFVPAIAISLFARKSLCCYNSDERGCGSVGRAPPLHGGGQGFESPQLHQKERYLELPAIFDKVLSRPGRVVMYKISLATGSRVDLQDITPKVQALVESSGIESGVCYVLVPHTTAGITVNEHADPSVVEDIAAQLEAMVPQRTSYRHMEGNAPAHIKASLVGNSETLLVENGKLLLGTWQGIFFCEFDGPRNRTVLVKIVPDKP